MNKIPITLIQDAVEGNSQYCKLLKERLINENLYNKQLIAIKDGLRHMGIETSCLKVFEENMNLIIWLGRRLAEYEGFELPLFIAYKKSNLPIPQGLAQRCPPKIILLIKTSSKGEYIYEFSKKLQESSLSVDIFLDIHQAMMNARCETVFSGLLSDLDRLTLTNFADIEKKIPYIYLRYLSEMSINRLLKKIATILRDKKRNLEEESKDINLYSLRLKEQLESLALETNQGLKGIIQNDVETGAEMNKITQKISNLFSRLERLFLGNIYHIKDYEKRAREIKEFFSQEENLRFKLQNEHLGRRKKIEEIYNEYLFFHRNGPLTREEKKLFRKSLTQKFEKLYRAKSKEVAKLHKFEMKGLLGVELNFDALAEAYHLVMKKIIFPDYIGKCFFDLVNCLPPAKEGIERLDKDWGNLAILGLKGKNILKLKPKTEYPREVKEIVERYQKCITVLVYDIRGSSYMGIRLHNAVKEQQIKNKFAREMVDIVKQYDGFLLKDTGDGGIIWFAENSGSLYKHLYTESITGRGIKLRYSIFSGAEFDLIPALDAAKRAILCARDMVNRAEEFIKANFMHYREWFAEVSERTVELEGVTYALLPPAFKSLFRIGVGIASGLPGRDIVFSANSYGDPDLVGPMLADANLYSMERQPGRSVTICDLPSLINLINNVEDFDYPVETANFTDYIQSAAALKHSSHGYLIPNHKILIRPKGIHLLEEMNKGKALSEKEFPTIYTDSQGTFYNEEKKKIKLFYEIICT